MQKGAQKIIDRVPQGLYLIFNPRHVNGNAAKALIKAFRPRKVQVVRGLFRKRSRFRGLIIHRVRVFQIGFVRHFDGRQRQPAQKKGIVCDQRFEKLNGAVAVGVAVKHVHAQKTAVNEQQKRGLFGVEHRRSLHKRVADVYNIQIRRFLVHITEKRLAQVGAHNRERL